MDVLTLLHQIFGNLKNTFSPRTVWTTFALVVAVSYMAYVTGENNRFVREKRLHSMRKVPLPASFQRQWQPRAAPKPPPSPMRSGFHSRQSQAKPRSPLSHLSRGIDRRRRSSSGEQDYDTRILLAMENARAMLLAADLKDVLPHEVYNFVSGCHPKHLPSAEFLTATTRDLKGYSDYNWVLYLRERRSRQRYISFNDLEVPSPRYPIENSALSGHIQGDTARPAVTDQVQSVDPQTVEHVHYPELPPHILGPWRMERNVLSENVISPTPGPILKRSLHESEGSATDAKKRRRLKLTPQDTESTMGRGGVAPQDSDICELLKTAIGPEDNKVVCAKDHPHAPLIQEWRLISKTNLLFDYKLFEHPLQVQAFIPDNFYTTFNAVNEMLGAIKVERPSDATILEALMGFGSELGVYGDERGRELVDAEYMQPRNPDHEWTEWEAAYWRASYTWRKKTLSDLGIQLQPDGRYITAGEEHARSMGWNMNEVHPPRMGPRPQIVLPAS